MFNLRLTNVFPIIILKIKSPIFQAPNWRKFFLPQLLSLNDNSPAFSKSYLTSMLAFFSFAAAYKATQNVGIWLILICFVFLGSYPVVMLCHVFDILQNKFFVSQLCASCFSALEQFFHSNYQITAFQLSVLISINFVSRDLFHSALMLQTHHTLLSLSSCRMRTWKFVCMVCYPFWMTTAPSSQALSSISLQTHILWAWWPL